MMPLSEFGLSGIHLVHLLNHITSDLISDLREIIFLAIH